MEGPSILGRVIDAALRARFLVLVGVVLLVVAGVRSAAMLPIDAVPDLTNVQVQIFTKAPGLGPEEVERLLTMPVESAIGGVPHVEELRSLTRFGLSVVTVVFDEDTDIYWARSLLSERLAQAREDIPSGYGEPELGPISSGLGEIFHFEVRGPPDDPDRYSLMDLRSVLDWQIAPRLRQVDGVVEVNTFGGQLKTWEVAIRPEALSARGLVLADVYASIEHNNRNAGGGYIQKGREQLLIRGEALLTSLDDLRAVVVTTTAEGTPVTVGDLGEVHFAPVIRQGAVTRDGRGEAVNGIVMMLLGENSRTVTERVKERLDEIATTLPPGVTLDVMYDRTDLVDRTIHTVEKNLLEGGLLVIAVLLLTLGSLRGGLVVAVAIPLSMLVAVTAMVQAGVSGNLMSLGAIDFGLIVDGSVVMVENILRVVGERRRKGLPVDIEHVREAAHDVARPIVYAVGIIILVYLPILTLGGMEGKMFKPMALTVVFALVGSLVLSLTLMPVLASLLLTRVDEKETRLLGLAHRLYRPMLTFALHHRIATVAVAVLAFVVSVAVAPFLGAEFVPTLDEGALVVNIARLPSVSLEESARQGTEVEKALLRDFPGAIQTTWTRTGQPEVATDPMGVDFSDVFVMLTPEGARDKAALVEAMQEALPRSVPGAKFSFSQPIEMRVNELVEGVRSSVAVMLYGEDLDQLARSGEDIAAVLGRVRGAEDVKVEAVAGLPVLQVRVDRAAVSRLGMNADDVLDAVEAIGGRQVGTVVQGAERYAIQVRVPEDVRGDVARIGELPVGRSGGIQVPLRTVATITVEAGPAQISREGGHRKLTVEANVRGRDIAGFVAEARARVDGEVKLPPGYEARWGGQFENLEQATGRLAVVVPITLLLIFVLLHAAFGSARLAGLVFVNVPLAVSGGVFALALRGLPFSISAGVGFIALFGIAVMNGVVLVSAARRLQREGHTAAISAYRGAELRLRPVLMTALVAALGFVPMALATSAGAEVQRPLATVVIGGLVTSTMLTLFVLPALYAWAMKGEDVPTPEEVAE